MPVVQHIHLLLAPSGDAAHVARDAVAELLPAHFPAEQRGDILVLVSELVTNAVLHGQEPLVLDASVDARAVRIEVCDASEEVPHLRAAGPSGGYGLRLVSVIAEHWGHVRTAAGKCVWAFMSWEQPPGDAALGPTSRHTPPRSV